MAGRINGATLHSWGEVPIDTPILICGNAGRVSGSTMRNKAAGLRFLIIDKISNVALKLFGALEKHRTQARQCIKHAMDAMGELLHWGCVDLIVVGDWLQLPAGCEKRFSATLA